MHLEQQVSVEIGRLLDCVYPNAADMHARGRRSGVDIISGRKELHTRARRRRGTGTDIASLHSTRGAASVAIVGIPVVAGLSPSLDAVAARG